MTVLCGIVVPNILPMIATIWIAMPARSAAILMYALVVMRASQMSTASLAVAITFIALVDVLIIITDVFHLDYMLLLDTLSILNGGKLFASPMYFGVLILVATSILINVVLVRRGRVVMGAANNVRVAGLIIVALSTDLWIANALNHTSYDDVSSNLSFESAAHSSGLRTIIDKTESRNDILIVIVESLGVLQAKAHSDLLFSRFQDDDLRRRFTITDGTIPFFGSTAYGEMRELCGARTSYKALDTDVNGPCIPKQLSQKGYRSVAVHGFDGSFYERTEWYPRIGFAQAQFQNELMTGAVRRCGSSFSGPCDADLEDTIDGLLSRAEKPNLVYWLTLNTHVPVKIGEAKSDLGCSSGGPVGDLEVCSMMELWKDLFDSIADLALRHPNTEILLVGDHAPPLWRRSARRMFDPDRVPWVRLAPRQEAARADEVAAAR